MYPSKKLDYYILIPRKIQLLIYLVDTQMSENRLGANQVEKSEIATQKNHCGFLI